MDNIGQCDDYWREKLNRKRKELGHPTDPEKLYDEANWMPFPEKKEE